MEYSAYKHELTGLDVQFIVTPFHSGFASREGEPAFDSASFLNCKTGHIAVQGHPLSVMHVAFLRRAPATCCPEESTLVQ
jgi:hypothetical protein